jgi:hypothetical protein
LNAVPLKPDVGQFAIPLVFFVTAEQNKIIEDALGKITTPPGQTKAQRRAAAITEIADSFLRIEKCQTTNV